MSFSDLDDVSCKNKPTSLEIELSEAIDRDPLLLVACAEPSTWGFGGGDPQQVVVVTKRV
jgi:hypothetical protein